MRVKVAKVADLFGIPLPAAAAILAVKGAKCANESGISLATWQQEGDQD
jgi:hypothetical protein